MNRWLDDGYAVIDRYARSLTVRTDKTRRLYRMELAAFQRFMLKRGNGDDLGESAVTAWIQARAVEIPLSLLIDRAGIVNRFLDVLVRDGALTTNPLGTLRDRYGERRLAPIVRALASTDPTEALKALRPLPRWASPLGPFMRDHLVLMRAMGPLCPPRGAVCRLRPIPSNTSRSHRPTA